VFGCNSESRSRGSGVKKKKGGGDCWVGIRKDRKNQDQSKAWTTCSEERERSWRTGERGDMIHREDTREKIKGGVI